MLVQKRLKATLLCGMLSREKSFLTEIKPLTVSSISARRESCGEENLKQLIQDVGSKAAQRDFAVRHSFEREVIFD